MSYRDTIKDSVPTRDHVHRRLRYMRLSEADEDTFIEYIPENLALASRLCIARDMMARQEIEVNADSLIDYAVSERMLNVR